MSLHNYIFGGFPSAADDNYWDDDPEFPVGDWKHEVADGNTRMGYWQWVEGQRGMTAALAALAAETEGGED